MPEFFSNLCQKYTHTFNSTLGQIYLFIAIGCCLFQILECFLQLRANSSYNLGFPDATTKQLRFSPFLCVDHKHGERPVSPPPVSPASSSHPPCTVTYLSLTHACKAVITCLKHERGMYSA